MITFPKSKPISHVELTRGLHAAVPNVLGVTVGEVFLSVKSVFDGSLEEDDPLFPDGFTQDEKALIAECVGSHDSIMVEDAKREKESKKLEKRNKDPKNLTNSERLDRLEMILGLDSPK